MKKDQDQLTNETKMRRALNLGVRGVLMVLANPLAIVLQPPTDMQSGNAAAEETPDVLPTAPPQQLGKTFQNLIP